MPYLRPASEGYPVVRNSHHTNPTRVCPPEADLLRSKLAKAVVRSSMSWLFCQESRSPACGKACKKAIVLYRFELLRNAKSRSKPAPSW